MQTNLTHLNANKFVKMAFVMFPQKMLFVIDFQQKCQVPLSLKDFLNKKKKNNTVWEQTKKIILVVK